MLDKDLCCFFITDSSQFIYPSKLIDLMGTFTINLSWGAIYFNGWS